MVLEHLEGETFLIPKLTMTICGTWPPNRRTLGGSIASVISLASKIANVIISMIDPSGNIHLDVPTMTTLAYTTYAFLAELSLRINSDRMVRLIDMNIDNWSSITNSKDQQIMRYHKKLGKSFFVFGILFYFVVPNVLDIIFFPYGVNPEWAGDQQDHHTWVSVVNMFVRFHYSLEEYGTMLLFWSLSMHLSKEFKILKTNFHKFLRIKCNERRRRVFRRLVDRHNELLKLSDDLRNSFFDVLMMEVFAIHIFTCDQAYRLALEIHNGDFMTIAATSWTIGMTMWLLFMLYNSGEFLTTCSEEIAEVFSQCKWYNWSEELRKKFAIVILQCRRPVKLTVGGLFKLNHSNYKHSVETLYSYISLILAITKPDG